MVVKRIAGQRVTLGIEAPQTTKIIRGELPTFESLLDELPQEITAVVDLDSLPSTLDSVRPR